MHIAFCVSVDCAYWHLTEQHSITQYSLLHIAFCVSVDCAYWHLTEQHSITQYSLLHVSTVLSRFRESLEHKEILNVLQRYQHQLSEINI